MIGYAINNYVWALCQKNLGWTKVGGLVPFIPAQQQPEFMNHNQPFVVYGFSTEYNDAELEPMEREIVNYVIYSKDDNDIDAFITLVKDAFKAFNAADNINVWLKSPINTTIADQDRENTVDFTEVMNTESAGETTSEGGRYDGFVSVRVGYKTNPQDYSI